MAKFTAGQYVVASSDHRSSLSGQILTRGKRYFVHNIGESSGRVRVEDDRGIKQFFAAKHFVSVDEYEFKKAQEELNRFEPGEIIPFHLGHGIVQHILVTPTKKPKRPRSIKIDPADAKAALSKMLKEVYGIDATVEQVIGAMDKSLELVLGA